MSARGQIDLMIEQYQQAGGDLSTLERVVVDLTVAALQRRNVTVRVEDSRAGREAEVTDPRLRL